MHAHTPSRPIAATTAVLAVAFGALGALSPPAMAGTYEAVACDDADGGDSSAWESEHDGANSTTSQLCPSDGDAARGLVASMGSRDNDNGSFARWSFEAPRGATLRELKARLRLAKTGDNYGTGIKTDDGVYRFGSQPGSSSFVDGDKGGGPNGSARTIELRGASNVSSIVECRNSGGCGDPDNGTFARLYAATVVVEENSNPDLDVEGGSLAPTGPLTQHGTADISFDAADGVGIKSARLLVDDDTKDEADFECDYAERVPCSDQSDRTLSFPVKSVGKGSHVARLVVVDAADNEATYERPFQVDDDGGGSSGGGGGGGGSSGGGGAGGPNGSGSSDTPAADGGVLGVSAVGDYVTLRPSRRVLRNGSLLSFSGQAFDGGVASFNTLVTIQARVGRRWVTFKVVRTDRLGGFRAAYRFRRTFRTQRYAFRAHVAAQGTMGVVDSRPTGVLVRR